MKLLKASEKEIYDGIGRETIFRSKVSWIGKGKKPCNYFFKLEQIYHMYEKNVPFFSIVGMQKDNRYEIYK